MDETITLVELTRRALRLAIRVTLDDDDTREKLYDWQIEKLNYAYNLLCKAEEAK